MAQTALPDSTRRLGNRHLDGGDVYLLVQPLANLGRRSGLEEQSQCFDQVVTRLLDAVALTGDIQLRAVRHVPVVLAFDNGSQLAIHRFLLHTSSAKNSWLRCMPGNSCGVGLV